jgi:hypothetical protein
LERSLRRRLGQGRGCSLREETTGGSTDAHRSLGRPVGGQLGVWGCGKAGGRDVLLLHK